MKAEFGLEFAGKREEAARSNEKAARARHAATLRRALDALRLAPPPANLRGILASGNEALVLGALADLLACGASRGGCAEAGEPPRRRQSFREKRRRLRATVAGRIRRKEGGTGV